MWVDDTTGGDGYQEWKDQDGDTWTITPGNDGKVTITGLQLPGQTGDTNEGSVTLNQL